MQATTRRNLKILCLVKGTRHKRNLFNSIYTTFWKGKTSERNQISGCQKLGMGMELTTEGNTREHFMVMDMFIILIVVVISQEYTHVSDYFSRGRKKHLTIFKTHFRNVFFFFLNLQQSKNRRNFVNLIKHIAEEHTINIPFPRK